MTVAYTKGLHELGDGLHAYLQPKGTWGWANAGLITADGTSLLVDTLFDLALTREMLDSMAPIVSDHPIDAAMNTHANGDHCFGNELLPDGIEIYASVAADEEMRAVTPELVHFLMTTDALGPQWRAFAEANFGAFTFSDITLRPPTQTFSGRLDLSVGDRAVSLVEVGPAHTAGDTIVHVPDADAVFSGDILFIEATPIVWDGPFSNWLRACDRILELDARVIVPGHGPVTDASGVRDVQRYLTYVRSECEQRHAAGMTVEEAADGIELTDFAGWGDPERIAVNVHTAYREIDASTPERTPAEQFLAMADWDARHR